MAPKKADKKYEGSLGLPQSSKVRRFRLLPKAANPV